MMTHPLKYIKSQLAQMKSRGWDVDGCASMTLTTEQAQKLIKDYEDLYRIVADSCFWKENDSGNKTKYGMDD
jgi:hypothetical protein